jgi:hypothetical protein
MRFRQTMTTCEHVSTYEDPEIAGFGNISQRVMGCRPDPYKQEVTG